MFVFNTFLYNIILIKFFHYPTVNNVSLKCAIQCLTFDTAYQSVSLNVVDGDEWCDVVYLYVWGICRSWRRIWRVCTAPVCSGCWESRRCRLGRQCSELGSDRSRETRHRSIPSTFQRNTLFIRLSIHCRIFSVIRNHSKRLRHIHSCFNDEYWPSLLTVTDNFLINSHLP